MLENDDKARERADGDIETRFDMFRNGTPATMASSIAIGIATQDFRPGNEETNRFGTTSVQLKSGNFAGFPCKRHQTKHLVISAPSLQAEGRRLDHGHVHQPFLFNKIAPEFFRRTPC